MTTKILLSIDDVVSATGLGRSKIYLLFRSGELVPVKIGSRTFVRRADLEAFIDAHVKNFAA